MVLQLLYPVNKRKGFYDVTIFQTQHYGQNKGYQQVYRLDISGRNHQDVADKVFKRFNVSDTMPNDYCARYVATGDIILIDEGKRGQNYYKLQSGGWEKINRIHVR
ncbi:hypothetical protein GJU40_12170 [Bacillus lacus]|uniref:YodL-like protein n=1 Tax=Metabacillus lacus TaxID=1983721 RepID=A0A7X2J055_9BACI|nr:YodL domain-containing protein [Metabacillus lacus]MRX72896.1 hypothetical protein [Metabacillus lacus]